jgi:hypothetical protein
MRSGFAAHASKFPLLCFVTVGAFGVPFFGCNRELRGAQTMSSVSVRSLYELASTGPSIRHEVPLELSASWPIPVRSGAVADFVFFYYRLSGPPAKPSFDVFPPVMTLRISANGEAGSPLNAAPGTLGLHVASSHVLGTHSWPTSWSQGDMDSKVAALLTAYDRVIPIWLSGGSPADARVQEFRRQFLELTESVLLPCYRTLGPDFFAWLLAA